MEYYVTLYVAGNRIVLVEADDREEAEEKATLSEGTIVEEFLQTQWIIEVEEEGQSKWKRR